MPSYKNSFVIDLSRVTNVDSRGLGSMLRLIRKAWAGNVAGCFLAPSRAVQSVRTEWDSRLSMREMVLDFGETDFIDSSGLGFLIRCHRMTAGREGSRLRLSNLRTNVLNVIRVAKLEGMLLTGEQKIPR